MSVLAVLLLSVLSPSCTIVCRVRAHDAPVPDAEVAVAGQTARTAANGEARMIVEPGTLLIRVAKEGFLPAAATATIAGGEEQTVVIELQRVPMVQEQVTVSATRTGKSLDDQPMRVEVVDHEDLQEEQAQTPGDISMVLDEKAGIRVQPTSPGIGATAIRVQGMRGRYTRVLFDGLPLLGDDLAGVGLLQIPPVDLGRIELIKGVASALYGAGALGGIIDLISRRPDATPTRQLLVNRSSRGATDTVLFAGQPISDRWRGTLLAGGHWQDKNDADGDGWADIAGYSRGVVRPRVFWDDKKGETLFATAGATWEQRRGGTAGGLVLPATGAPFVEGLQTARFDAGLVGQVILGGRYVLTARLSATRQRHDHQFGETLEVYRGDSVFGEVALRGTAGRHTWVGGLAFERSIFNPEHLDQFSYRYNVPAVFAQDDVTVGRWLSLSASGRLDVHNVFGVFVSPRLSALMRSGGWNARVSAGTGFISPTPLTEETQVAGLTRLSIPTPLLPERGRNVSFDLTRTAGPMTVTATLFGSVVHDPIALDREHYLLQNLPQSTTNVGAELLARWAHDPFAITATYTYVDAREGVGTERGDMPLTPRHSIGAFASWDEEDWGRVALEWFFSSPQRLEDNPYRMTSVSYMVFGALIEHHIRRVTLFLNAENLGNVRQTHWDPLIRPAPAADGRWTVDSWAPLDGRVVNGGFRLRF
jgi:outer membrane receptor for ferrienterochelin and colicins